MGIALKGNHIFSVAGTLRLLVHHSRTSRTEGAGTASRKGVERSMLTKREFLKGSAAMLATLPFSQGCSATHQAAPDNRVIVLGFDGLDPLILERPAMGKCRT